MWFAAVLLAGCGGSGKPDTTKSSGTGGQNKQLVIAVIPKGTSHEFWKSVHAGAEQAAKEIGDVQIDWQGPSIETDVNQQIAIVQNVALKGVDGIVLAPNHSESLVDAVRQANDHKVPVVIFDSGLAEGAEYVSYVATDNENGGRLAAQQMAKALGEKGNVIVMRYLEGSESTEQRERGFLEEIAKFPQIKVLSSDQYAGQSTESAKAKAEQLLLQYKDAVNGFFAVCEPNANGTLLALENTGLAGKVKFLAFDPSDQLIEGLKAGTVEGIVLQDPVRMGYLSVKTIVGHIRGQTVEKRVPTGEAVATKENMESEAIRKLLHPVQQE
jgi:ribose transport system substrate-binding protein